MARSKVFPAIASVANQTTKMHQYWRYFARQGRVRGIRTGFHRNVKYRRESGINARGDWNKFNAARSLGPKGFTERAGEQVAGEQEGAPRPERGVGEGGDQTDRFTWRIRSTGPLLGPVEREGDTGREWRRARRKAATTDRETKDSAG